NLFPCRIVGCAAAMTFVNDDQVKKARREFPEELLAVLRPRNGLIKSQVNLVSGVDSSLLVQGQWEFDVGAVLPFDSLRARAQFRHDRAERTKIIDHRLIDKDIAVGQEEDALLAAGLP